MRIGFISAMASHPWGGSEDLWCGAARELRTLGHHVGGCVQGWSETHPRINGLAALGVEIFERRPHVPTKWQSRLERLLRRLGQVTAEADPVEAWLLAFRPELVCVSNGNFKDGLRYLELLRRLKIPFVSIVQANAEFLWPRDEDADRLLAAYRAAQRIYCVSEANHRLLEKQLGSRLPHSEVVRNPYQVPRAPGLAWPSTDQGWCMACVGRLEPDAKGQDLLFEVLSADRWRNRPLRLSLYGSGSAERGLRRLVEMYGLAGTVEFWGHVPEVTEVWKNHHLLVLPSRYEGLPLAVVEAMMCSRPIVVTDIAGNAELLRDGESGFVAKAPNVKELDETLERAWAARERWESMGISARAAALSAIPEDPCQVFAKRLVEGARESTNS